MKQLEIEFKTLLSQADYQRLCDYYQLKAEQFHTQTNVYFDTPQQALRKKRCGLRIRRYAERGEITLKIPQPVGLLEITDPLTLDETNEWIAKQSLPADGAVANELQRLNVALSELHVIAELTTKRAEFQIDEGLLALDESWYQTQHDYELELEVTDAEEGRAAFDRYLQRFSLPYVAAENKILRATRQK